MFGCDPVRQTERHLCLKAEHLANRGHCSHSVQISSTRALERSLALSRTRPHLGLESVSEPLGPVGVYMLGQFQTARDSRDSRTAGRVHCVPRAQVDAAQGMKKA